MCRVSAGCKLKWDIPVFRAHAVDYFFLSRSLVPKEELLLLHRLGKERAHLLFGRELLRGTIKIVTHRSTAAGKFFLSVVLSLSLSSRPRAANNLLNNKDGETAAGKREREGETRKQFEPTFERAGPPRERSPASRRPNKEDSNFSSERAGEREGETRTN